MKQTNFKDEVEMPEGVQASVENGLVTIKGQKGEVPRNLFHPQIKLTVETNKIVLSTKSFDKNTKKLFNTFKAHLANMTRGVQEGHVYKLKICSGHFPMTVSVKDTIFEIKNFIGEKVPRIVNIIEGTTVKVDGTEVVVESIDKEKAGQMAGSIEQLTRRPGFDKRIFQDGIYITEKDGKQIK